MSLTKRQQALLARPLSSLKKLSPYAQYSLAADAHRYRNPDSKFKRTPKMRKHYLQTYTIGDVFENWKARGQSFVNPTGLTFPVGVNRLMIDLLAKAGFTRFDLAWLPQETLTLKVMRTRTKEEWLDTPLYYLGTLPRAALASIAYFLGKGDVPNRWYRNSNKDQLRSVLVRDLLAINIDYQSMYDSGTGMYTLWWNREQSMNNTQQLLYKLGFTYEDSPVMQYGTDRRAVELLMGRHKISKRTARMVIRIAKREGWKVDAN